MRDMGFHSPPKKVKFYNNSTPISDTKTFLKYKYFLIYSLPGAESFLRSWLVLS